MPVLGLSVQTAVLEQFLQCFLSSETPLQCWCPSACGKVTGNDDLYRRLLCKRVDGLVQRGGGQVYIELFLALDRHCDKQATDKQ
ncbi:hypothetical protein D3C80_1496930 [compost metagenome]